MWQKIVLGVGILGCLLGGVITIITLVLHVSSDGNIADDEAIWGYLGGGCCCSLSLVLAVVGLVFVLKSRKKPDGGAGLPPAPPAPPAA